MPNYLRPKVTGACIFFTVALARRDGTVLVDEVDALRRAVRVTRDEGFFEIGACVSLPAHLYCVWAQLMDDRSY